MPEDVDAVVSEFLGARAGGERPGRMRSVHRLARGVVALDYGDDEHAFQLVVEQVPRWRRALRQPVRIGHVDGVEADLLGVTIDNFVHVELTAAPTDERDRLTRRYADAFGRWAATSGTTTEDPPDQPAGRLMRITITVSDSRGTSYRLQAGRCGGTGTEWEATQSFRPRPPAEVGELRIALQAPGQPEVVVPVLL